MPSHTCLFPFGEPFEFSTRGYEELHLHLFELTHTEDKLTSNNLITERFTNLGDTERYLHATSLLHIQIVHEDTLSRFRTQVHLHRTIGRGTHLRREHQIELTNVCPVTCTTDRTNNLLVKNNLLQLLQIRSLHGSSIASMKIIAFLLRFLYTLAGLHIFRLIESITETLTCLLHLFLNLLVILGNLILDEHISTITLLRITVVNKGVIESIHVT